MEDPNILQALSARIASFSFGGPQSLAGIARDLEILFERLGKRNPRLERAYHDFWNAAEVISVACMDEKRPITEKEINDAKALLKKFEDTVNKEIQRLRC